MTPGFDDYVGMCGLAQAWTTERMLEHYAIDMGRWTQIVASWNQSAQQEPARYGQYGVLVEQEARRIKTGGAPRAVNLASPTASAPPAPGPGPAAPAPGPAAPPGSPAGGPTLERQAEHAVNAAGYAAVAGFQALGSAFGAAATAIAGPNPGARVLVTWSDGNRYPGTVAQSAQGQVLVTMSDGRQLWVPAHAVAVV